MKYSFVFVLCLGALVMQCSCRPQMDSTTPPAETVSTDAETPTDTTEQVVFDENQGNAAAAPADNQDDEGGFTTEPPALPVEEDPTTVAPCSGDCASGIVTDEQVVDANPDAPSAPNSQSQETPMGAADESSNDDAQVTTGLPPLSE